MAKDQKAVTLSRFFDSNVRLVADARSRCHCNGDDDDVVVVATSQRVFLGRAKDRRKSRKRAAQSLHNTNDGNDDAFDRNKSLPENDCLKLPTPIALNTSPRRQAKPCRNYNDRSDAGGIVKDAFAVGTPNRQGPGGTEEFIAGNPASRKGNDCHPSGCREMILNEHSPLNAPEFFSCGSCSAKLESIPRENRKLCPIRRSDFTRSENSFLCRKIGGSGPSNCSGQKREELVVLDPPDCMLSENGASSETPIPEHRDTLQLELARDRSSYNVDLEKMSTPRSAEPPSDYSVSKIEASPKQTAVDVAQSNEVLPLNSSSKEIASAIPKNSFKIEPFSKESGCFPDTDRTNLSHPRNVLVLSLPGEEVCSPIPTNEGVLTLQSVEIDEPKNDTLQNKFFSRGSVCKRPNLRQLARVSLSGLSNRANCNPSPASGKSPIQSSIELCSSRDLLDPLPEETGIFAAFENPDFTGCQSMCTEFRDKQNIHASSTEEIPTTRCSPECCVFQNPTIKMENFPKDYVLRNIYFAHSNKASPSNWTTKEFRGSESFSQEPPAAHLPDITSSNSAIKIRECSWENVRDRPNLARLKNFQSSDLTNKENCNPEPRFEKDARLLYPRFCSSQDLNQTINESAHEGTDLSQLKTFQLRGSPDEKNCNFEFSKEPQIMKSTEICYCNDFVTESESTPKESGPERPKLTQLRKCRSSSLPSKENRNIESASDEPPTLNSRQFCFTNNVVLKTEHFFKKHAIERPNFNKLKEFQLPNSPCKEHCGTGSSRALSTLNSSECCLKNDAVNIESLLKENSVEYLDVIQLKTCGGWGSQGRGSCSTVSSAEELPPCYFPEFCSSNNTNAKVEPNPEDNGSSPASNSNALQPEKVPPYKANWNPKTTFNEGQDDSLSDLESCKNLVAICPLNFIKFEVSPSGLPLRKGNRDLFGPCRVKLEEVASVNFANSSMFASPVIKTEGFPIENGSFPITEPPKLSQPESIAFYGSQLKEDRNFKAIPDPSVLCKTELGAIPPLNFAKLLDSKTFGNLASKFETLPEENPTCQRPNLDKLSEFSTVNPSKFHSSKLEFSLKRVGAGGPSPPLWNPPRSPHNLIEETLFHDPWALLVATIFLNKTSCMCARPRVEEFLRDFSGPLEVLERRPADLERYFLDLGLFKRRAEQVWRMSYDFVHKDWRHAKELYGIGKYGEDAYRMFVLGDLDVEPTDRFLRIYRDFARMKEKERKDAVCCDDD